MADQSRTSQLIYAVLALSLVVSCARTKTVANSRDAAKEGASFTYENADPPGTIQSPKMSINEGAEATNEIVVDLNLSVLGAQQVYITNTAECADGGEWQTFLPIIEWTLPLDNAENKVYARFRNRGGVESPCVNASIIHDNIGPIMSGELDDGDWINSRVNSPFASWEEAGDGTGIGLKEYEIAIGTEPSTDDFFPWTKVGTVLQYELTGLVLPLKKTLYTSVRAVDMLGNIGKPLSGDGWQATEWKARYYFKSSVAARSAQFGTAVGLAKNIAAVGMVKDNTGQNFISSPDDMPTDGDANSSGAVMMFEKTSAGWSSVAYIKADNVGPQDRFGSAIALSFDTLVVGVPLEDSNLDSIINAEFAADDNSSPDSGAVYVYRRAGTNWKQEAFIKAPNSDDGDLFGTSVALYGEFLVVGAPGEDSAGELEDNSSPNAGAAYVFQRKGSKWEFNAYLKAPNADDEDGFGSSVSIGENTIVIGAPKEDGGDFAISYLPENAGTDNSAPDSGAAYVFGRQGSDWLARAYLKGHGGEEADGFGYAVTISGTGVMAISAPFEDGAQKTKNGSSFGTLSNNVSASGAVYLFESEDNKWKPSAFLKASNVSSNAEFGFSLGSYNDRIIVGSVGDKSMSTRTLNSVNLAATDSFGTDVGSAYVFYKGDTGWYQEAYMKAPNSRGTHQFGFAVAIHDTDALVTTPFERSNAAGVSKEFSDDHSVLSSGAAYLFSVFE